MKSEIGKRKQRRINAAIDFLRSWLTREKNAIDLAEYRESVLTIARVASPLAYGKVLDFLPAGMTVRAAGLIN